MRKVVAFLVWLFSFWTWKDLFLRWLGNPRSPSSARAPTTSAELLLSPATEPESEFARFLSSLPEDGRSCKSLEFYEETLIHAKFDGGLEYVFGHGADVEAGHRYSALLETAASSKTLFSESLFIKLHGMECCQHTEALAEVFRQSGIRFRSLRFFFHYSHRMRFAKCFSSVLLGQDELEELDLDFYDFFQSYTEMREDVVAELMTNIHPLRRLKSFTIRAPLLGEKATEQLLKPFKQPHSVLETFCISVSSGGQLECVSGLLATTTSLKSLTIRAEADRREGARGYSRIAAALGSNHSVKSLTCKLSSSMELKALLDPLIPNDNNLQENTTLTQLGLGGSIGGKEGVDFLADFIRTNNSLLKLDLWDLEELRSDGVEGVENALAILHALKANKSLKWVSFLPHFWGDQWFDQIFVANRAVGGYKVLGAMMDLLLENHCIEDMDLEHTLLGRSGDAEYVHSELEKRRKMKMWGVVRGMTNAKPTSGRVFLCGEPYAGKTQLRTTMKTLEEFQNPHEIPSSSRLKKWCEKFKKPKDPDVTNDEKPLERTHGIEVDIVQCNGIGITIWDMAGQTDYHSFHELVMPNLSADGSSSLFMLMCNPMEASHPSGARSRLSIREELETWLRFIASNTRRSLSYRPHVSIVMTHYDYWKDDATLAKCIEDVVKDLKSQFQEVLEFDEDIVAFKVNGKNGSHARDVFDFIKSHLKQLLERLPKTLSACQEVQQRVAKWNLDKSNPRLLMWNEFCEVMCNDVEELKDGDDDVATTKKEFVAISLNDGGHIIYKEKEGAVITSPHWFCHWIMGEFLHQCASKGRQYDMVSQNGIISHSDAKHFVLNLLQGQDDVEKKFDHIFSIMMKLHVCYEQDENHILIPSTLIDKHDTLSWCDHDGSSTFNYVGRRLACKDKKKTMLTAGFFTRLQVSFFKKLESKNVQETYQVFHNVIKFINDGVEVILQFIEGDIDILLRSHQSQDTMIDLVDNFIVLHIKQLQMDPTLGCPGVLLEQFILRPACVRCLVHFKDRKNQCASMKELEFEVVKYGAGVIYNWKPCKSLGVDFDNVKTLLGDLAWSNILKRRSSDLQECQQKISTLGVSIEIDPLLCDDKKGGPSSASLKPSWLERRYFGAMHEKLDNIAEGQVEDRTVREKHHKELMLKLENLERDIKKMEGELLPAVCSKINNLMAFSLEMKTSRIPKLAYLCEVGKEKLLTKLVPGLDEIQLHLMCERLQGFHKVKNQKGCTVSFGTPDTKRFLAMISWGLKIATILTKVGAHVVCGMGAMVPDFSDGVSYGALVLDSNGFLENYQIPNSSLESLPSHAKKFSTISTRDISEAQRWLTDFLEPKCQKRRDFHELFNLSKVKYHGSSGPIAWICDACVEDHQHEFDALP